MKRLMNLNFMRRCGGKINNNIGRPLYRTTVRPFLTKGYSLTRYKESAKVYFVHKTWDYFILSCIFF